MGRTGVFEYVCTSRCSNSDVHNLLLDNAKRLDIKKRGIDQLSIPRVEALALPIIVEQTTSEATPYEDSPTTQSLHIRVWLHLYGTIIPL